ncbi:hypothetical protein [Mycolicibacterium vanbaalenii]|uniref:hypothetical protein n=1 Tax=Mycolicibacterium vanbaalenii TaxID=110539 RepID=UPI001EEFE8D2|nr:hypothetical protein [Mycolicibacterium vanbaalenii]
MTSPDFEHCALAALLQYFLDGISDSIFDIVAQCGVTQMWTTNRVVMTEAMCTVLRLRD